MTPLYTENGTFRYRTKALSLDHARSFAQCVEANRTRFFNIAIEQCPRTKGDKCWFVTFQPVNPDRMADIAEREQATRTENAEREGADYLFILDRSDAVPTYRCFNPVSGETYELTATACRCADYTYRLSQADGIRCKHGVEMDRRVACGDLVPLSAVEWTEAA